ncbi:MAG: metallophosphoesterase family protein [Verrucomicrobiales bacterium]|nr:metallophosphoesterase family protein [Verrucomicrobiales bacterium]MCP5525917.1 metallophosphoesterase family protein [Verrucomicrobiales bacterium]
MARIGLISDTHNHLPPQVLEIFTGVDHILHAGDIGQPRILLQLEAIAPVTAVAGNTDYDPSYRETERLQLAGLDFLVQHIVDPHHLHGRLAEHLRTDPPDVLVFGHTHRTFCQRVDGVLFVNPGSASRPRLGGGCSVAILRATDAGPEVDFHPVPL